MLHWKVRGDLLPKSQHKAIMNVLALRAVKYSILTFSPLCPIFQLVHIKMNNLVPLSYLVKVDGTQNQSLTILSTEIWTFLLNREITITL